MVSIPACHAGDRGSIPRRGGVSFVVSNYIRNKAHPNVSILIAVTFLLPLWKWVPSFLTSPCSSVYVFGNASSRTGEVSKTRSSLNNVVNDVIVLESGLRIVYCIRSFLFTSSLECDQCFSDISTVPHHINFPDLFCFDLPDDRRSCKLSKNI